MAHQHDSPQQYDSFQALIDSITPEILANLKSAVETGRWPDGNRLTPQQVEHSLQAIIAYEARYVSEEHRTGFIDKTTCGSEPAREDFNESPKDPSVIATTKPHLH